MSGSQAQSVAEARERILIALIHQLPESTTHYPFVSEDTQERAQPHIPTLKRLVSGGFFDLSSQEGESQKTSFYLFLQVVLKMTGKAKVGHQSIPDIQNDDIRRTFKWLKKISELGVMLGREFPLERDFRFPLFEIEGKDRWGRFHEKPDEFNDQFTLFIRQLPTQSQIPREHDFDPRILTSKTTGGSSFRKIIKRCTFYGVPKAQTFPCAATAESSTDRVLAPTLSSSDVGGEKNFIAVPANAFAFLGNPALAIIPRNPTPTAMLPSIFKEEDCADSSDQHHCFLHDDDVKFEETFEGMEEDGVASEGPISATRSSAMEIPNASRPSHPAPPRNQGGTLPLVVGRPPLVDKASNDMGCFG